MAGRTSTKAPVDTDPVAPDTKVEDTTATGTVVTRTVPAVPAYEPFVDESTRENYRQIARDIAIAEGTTPEAGLAKLAEGFRAQHETDPAAGWGHLAEWAAAEGDPGPGTDGSLDAVEKARAVESALRDPSAFLAASTEAQEAAEAELARRAAPAAEVGGGVTPNTGPAVGVDTEASSADQTTVGPFAGGAPTPDEA